jgi:anti-anti-sigma regulatory factor
MYRPNRLGECHILRRAVLSHPYIEIVVLDMGEISTIDAAGVGLLVELRKWAAAKRMQLKLLYLTPHGANLLNITHVTPIFDVCSVRDVIDLLFRANQSSLAAGLAAPGAVADVIVPGL